MQMERVMSRHVAQGVRSRFLPLPTMNGEQRAASWLPAPAVPLRGVSSPPGHCPAALLLGLKA